MENPICKVLATFLIVFVLMFAVTSVNAQFCTFTTQDVACNGESTGIIAFSPSGGTAPYDYAWSHNGTINTNEVFNLPANTYTITITDSAGAEEICSVEITQPTRISITNVAETDPMCGLMDGSFVIDAVPQSGGSMSDLMYSIDGGGSFQTSNTFTGLGAADYLIIVADVNGCFIVESRQLVSAATVFLNLNSGMCDPGGTISLDITASGGTSPYTYAWSNGASTEDLNAVAPGSYSVTVTDREGCFAIGDYSVTDCCDATMFCDATIVDAGCSGDSNGSIAINPSGGTAPYTYVWSHDATLTSNVATDLAQGFYNVTTTDANGCEANCGHAVDESTAIVINDVDTVDPACGGMNGSLTINAPGASQFSIDNGATLQASNIFQNLGAGTYNVVALDANGCATTEVVSLTNSAGLTINLLDSSCATSNTINISVMGSGGVAPLTYAWSGEAGFSNPSPTELTGAQGTYTVVVTDAGGCTAEATYTQDNCCDSGMFCTTTVVNANCNDASNGEITVAPNGGTGPYSYVWSHDVTNTTNNAEDLSAGFYSVTIADAGGCSAVCGIDVTEPTAIQINDVAAQNPMCGLADGSLMITAAPKSGSGCSDLEYSVDGGMNFQVSNQFSNLASGDYLVIVRDCDNCSSFESTQLFDAGGLNISFTTDCAGSLVDIDVTAMGGVAPYTYEWEGPNGVSTTSEDIIGGVTGTYNVTVTDAGGCQDFAMITQNMCCVLEATCPADATDVPCGNFSDIPTEFLNTDADGGNDAAVFVAMGGTISAFPGPCGDVVITASDAMTGLGCVSDPLVLVRTFIITDGVSTVTCEMTMTGGDDGLPTIDVEASDLVVDCPEDLDQSFADWLASNGGATASDDCGVVAWSNDAIGVVLEFDVSFAVTFTATDNCGNVATTTASYMAIACPQGGDIGGEVWEDLDGNGSQDGGEPFLEQIPVTLFTSQGVLVSTQFTNTSGTYLFEDIPHGEYIIHFGPSFEYSFTLPNVGSDASDSDVDQANGSGTTTVINHTGGDRNYDAGVHICATVGELVWFDVNTNDQWDPTENGINGLQVKVYKQGLTAGFYEYDNTNTGLNPETPSEDGYYKFCLPPGTYYLEFLIPPFGLVPVVSGVGGSDVDSDITGANGENTTSTFTVLSGDEKCDVGAGYYPMATIGNSVFSDDNSNGIADIGELGMANVGVELYDAVSGEMIESMVTDAQGSYLFDYLGKDDYFIKVIPPTDYQVTTANVGNDEGMDSDIDNSNGPNTSAMYALTPGMELDNVDVGLVDGIVVAVDWINVSGENRGDHNQVEWTVAFQNSTDFYEVERRLEDELLFAPIGKVEATNSIAIQTYNYQDFDVENLSLVYYRIAEYDMNGNVSYSDMIVVNSEVIRAATIAIAPNPFVDEMIIEVDTPIESEATIRFWDASGQKVEIQGFETGRLSAGMNRLAYDWNDVPTGVYSAQISIDGNQVFKKLIKIE